MTRIDTLAYELADLTPIQLERMVREHPRPLPFSRPYYVRDIHRLAAALLEHDSLGDAIARCHWYARMYDVPPERAETPKPPPRGYAVVDPVSWSFHNMLHDWWQAIKALLSRG